MPPGSFFFREAFLDRSTRRCLVVRGSLTESLATELLPGPVRAFRLAPSPLLRPQSFPQVSSGLAAIPKKDTEHCEPVVWPSRSSKGGPEPVCASFVRQPVRAYKKRPPRQGLLGTDRGADELSSNEPAVQCVLCPHHEAKAEAKPVQRPCTAAV